MGPNVYSVYRRVFVTKYSPTRVCEIFIKSPVTAFCIDYADHIPSTDK